MRKLLGLLMGLSAAMLLTAATAGSALAAGMITHNTVGQRALMYFASAEYPEYAEMMREHQDAFQAGTTFPDWGYAMDGFHDEAEEAHWEPFTAFAINWVRENKTQPWDEHTQRLLVFLLGSTAHGVADVSWHSLNSTRAYGPTGPYSFEDEGLITVMSRQDFNYDWGAAHSHADLVDEFMVSKELDVDWLRSDWWAPIDDLVEIYHAYFTAYMGRESLITAENLETGLSIFVLGSQSSALGGWVFWEQKAMISPWLAEQFQDWHLGGVDDMSVWTNYIWHDIIDWAENGVPGYETAADTKSAGIRDHGIGMSEEHECSHNYVKYLAARGMMFYDEGLLHMERERDANGGVTFHTWVDGWLADQNPAAADKAAKATNRPDAVDRSVTFRSETRINYLGQALAAGDYNNDGLDDLAMGAHGYWEAGVPQMGRVYVTYGRTSDTRHTKETVEKKANWTAHGGDYDRFGYALATLDFNADGIDDLAVGSPTKGGNELLYNGEVNIFFGSGDGLSDEPDVTISTPRRNLGLGYTFGRGDLNDDGYDDLIIGAPYNRHVTSDRQSGSVFVFFANAANDAAVSLDAYDADWIAGGISDWQYFGWSLKVVPMDDGARLIVGSPYDKVGIVQGAGSLNVYEFTSANGYDPLNYYLAIVGEQEFEKLGTNIDAGDFNGDGATDYLIASTTRDSINGLQTGVVDFFDLGDVPSSYYTRSDLADQLHGAILGDEEVARFGWKTAAGDVNNDGIDDLWITKPWHDINNLGRKNAQAGAAYLYLGNPYFTNGTMTTPGAGAHWALLDADGQTRFGSNVVLLDFNGDGSLDTAIAAKRDSSLEYLGGAVTLLLTPAPTVDKISPTVGTPGVQQVFTLTGKRLIADNLVVSLDSTKDTAPLTCDTSASPETLTCTGTLPGADAIGATTAWDLHVQTLYGKVTLEDAVETETEGGCGS
ncbi:MAG: FG-GAP repeat protein [Deltaproteobacteria bacterium]|nr:FG-GAP repeat protein [Deltaproteobacteria bacterium]MCB9488026.1 FG-GAP repeat protein [Deltaproteobacteria bacterium]